MSFFVLFCLVTASGYQVLSTDYTNYAIEWRCDQRGRFQHQGKKIRPINAKLFDIFNLNIRVLLCVESLWIMTRTPYPKAWIVAEAHRVISALGLKVSSLRSVSQDCHVQKVPFRVHHPNRNRHALIHNHGLSQTGQVLFASAKPLVRRGAITL